MPPQVQLPALRSNSKSAAPRLVLSKRCRRISFPMLPDGDLHGRKVRHVARGLRQEAGDEGLPASPCGLL